MASRRRIESATSCWANSRFATERRSQYESVHVTGMVEHEHSPPRRNFLHAADRERYAHDRKRATPDPSERRPARLRHRQDNHGKAPDDECAAEHDPPPGGVEIFAEQTAEPPE